MAGQTDSDELKFVFLGDQGVGKTALLATLEFDDFSSTTEYVPTVVSQKYASVDVGGVDRKVVLWDTGGQEAYNKVVRASFAETDVFFLTFSYTNPTSLENIKERWVHEIRGSESGHGTGVMILVGTQKNRANAMDPEKIHRVCDDIGVEWIQDASAEDAASVKSLITEAIKIHDQCSLKRGERRFSGLVQSASELFENVAGRVSDTALVARNSLSERARRLSEKTRRFSDTALGAKNILSDTALGARNILSETTQVMKRSLSNQVHQVDDALGLSDRMSQVASCITTQAVAEKVIIMGDTPLEAKQAKLLVYLDKIVIKDWQESGDVTLAMGEGRLTIAPRETEDDDYLVFLQSGIALKINFVHPDDAKEMEEIINTIFNSNHDDGLAPFG